LLPALNAVLLGANALAGPIPTELGEMSSLEVLHLEGNQLTGSLPLEVVSSPIIDEIFVTSNKLSGTIPTEIGLATALRYLGLGRNGITGAVGVDWKLVHWADAFAGKAAQSDKPQCWKLRNGRWRFSNVDIQLLCS